MFTDSEMEKVQKAVFNVTDCPLSCYFILPVFSVLLGLFSSETDMG